MPAKKKTTPFPDHLLIRDRILEAALPDVPFDGWTWSGIEKAALAVGYEKNMAAAVFPGGLPDAVAHFSDLADRRMLERLERIDPQSLRVRDRIREAVLARLRALQSWKDAERQAIAFWLMPWRAGMATKTLWRTADRIWNWAGDEARNYNHYTKRALLCAVLKATILVWLNDRSAGMADTAAFLDRRIENVVQFGRTIGKFRKTG